MKGYRAFGMALLLAVAAQGHAQTLIGMGTATCGRFNEEIKANGGPVQFYYESWAVGFLSGLNVASFYKFDILKTTDSAAISGAYKQYCAEHPLEQFAVAVLNVATQLAQREAPPETKSKKK